MSRFIVCVDLEGIACAVPQLGQTIETSFSIEYIRKQAAREASAAVRALFDQGAEDVIVWDNHGRGVSLDPDLLDPRCRIAVGATVYGRFPVMDETLTGVVLIGYHAMAGTPDAVLAHTFSSAAYQAVMFDDTPFGEIAFDAACAGALGVPVIFVSSCDKGVAEARHFLPWIESVTTKESLAYHRIISKHPAAVVDEIYQGVTRAVGTMDRMKPFTVPAPISCTVRYTRLDEAQSARLIDMHGKPFAWVDSYTRTGTLASIEHFVAQRPEPLAATERITS